MCNFSQIYPMDRGTNYAVRDGNRMAEKVMASIEGRRSRVVVRRHLTEEGTARRGNRWRRPVNASPRRSLALVDAR